MRVAQLIYPRRVAAGTVAELCSGAENPQRLVEQASIVLLAAGARKTCPSPAESGISRHTEVRWRRRLVELGIGGLEKEAPRPGRTPKLDREEIIRKTTQEKPENATH